MALSAQQKTSIATSWTGGQSASDISKALNVPVGEVLGEVRSAFKYPSTTMLVGKSTSKTNPIPGSTTTTSGSGGPTGGGSPPTGPGGSSTAVSGGTGSPTSGGGVTRGTSGFFDIKDAGSAEVNAEATKHLNDKIGKVTEAEMASFLFGDAKALQNSGFYKNYVANYQIQEGIDPNTGVGRTPGGVRVSTPKPTIDPGTGMIWQETDGVNQAQWIKVADPSYVAPTTPTPVDPNAPSTNVFSPGSPSAPLGTSAGTVDLPGGGTANSQSTRPLDPAAGGPGGIPRHQVTPFGTELAVQQSELDRQQLSGALNQRGIAQSGRADLLQDIQGLQAEKRIGGAIEQAAQPRPEFGDVSFAPSQPGPQQPVPTGPRPQQFAAPSAFASKNFDAPELSELQEPDAFTDIRAALSAFGQGQASTLGQGQNPLDVGNAAESAAMRQLSTVMPGLGNLDPFLALEAQKNGLGRDGRMVATPQELFEQELDARRESRQLDQVGLGRSILQSWRRAEVAQAQQDALLAEFRKVSQDGGFDPNAYFELDENGQPLLDENGQRVRRDNLQLQGQQSKVIAQNRQNANMRQNILRQLQKIEQMKVAAAQRTQEEFKRWQAMEKERLTAAATPKGVGQGQAFKTGMSQHHENLAARWLRHEGIDPRGRASNGMTNQQNIMTKWNSKKLEDKVARQGRGQS